MMINVASRLPLNDGDDGHEFDQNIQKFFYLDLMAFDTLAFGALAFFLLAILDDPEPVAGYWASGEGLCKSARFTMDQG